MSKEDAFKDKLAEHDYMVSGETVAEIVLALLNLVTAFIGHDEAKALLDQMAVQKANEDADALERAKFGGGDN